MNGAQKICISDELVIQTHFSMQSANVGHVSRRTISVVCQQCEYYCIIGLLAYTAKYRLCGEGADGDVIEKVLVRSL